MLARMAARLEASEQERRRLVRARRHLEIAFQPWNRGNRPHAGSAHGAEAIRKARRAVRAFYRAFQGIPARVPYGDLDA